MSFNSTIQQVRDGQLLELLTGKLQEVVEAVEETGKVGGLTLSLKVKPNGEGAVTLISDVKAKVPEPAVGDAIFFVSNGNLVRNNPHQADLIDELEERRSQKEEA